MGCGEGMKGRQNGGVKEDRLEVGVAQASTFS